MKGNNHPDNEKQRPVPPEKKQQPVPENDPEKISPASDPNEFDEGDYEDINDNIPEKK